MLPEWNAEIKALVAPVRNPQADLKAAGRKTLSWKSFGHFDPADSLGVVMLQARAILSSLCKELLAMEDGSPATSEIVLEEYKENDFARIRCIVRFPQGFTEEVMFVMFDLGYTYVKEQNAWELRGELQWIAGQ